MKDKTILITGASRGLGSALARHWQDKNTIICIAREASQIKQENIYFYPCDLSQEQQIFSVTKEILEKFPKIDLLINNAAFLKTTPLGIMRNQDISSMIDVNLKAPILISKAVYRKMVKQKSGQIINILSMASRLNIIGDSVYSATKSGLESFSKILNKEGHIYGVHVNNIMLSAFPSGMLDQIIKVDPDRILKLIPHEQFAPLHEIVSAIEFFEGNSIDIGGQTISFGGI